ncbi:retrovirus-related pol polyprotein from transposon TNT 1-94 [Tanacetum coccineum]
MGQSTIMDADEVSEIDPYEEVAQQGQAAPPSPAYTPDPLELEDHVPVYVTEPEEDPEGDSEEDPVDYAADAYDDEDDEGVMDHVPSTEETEPFETDKSAATPPPPPVDRLLAIPTPPPSPLTPLSSPFPHIPSPPLPVVHVKYLILFGGSIPINRGLIQAISTSLPSQPIGEATKASKRLPTFEEFHMESKGDHTLLTFTNKKTVSKFNCVSWQVVQICLWCVDSGCSKHMTGNIKLLINFVWKFLGTVRFGNDHIAAILGYGDLKWGNITIARVYFVEGLGHNLFSVGQFCDADLEVAFRRNTCFIRDLDGVDLLKGNRTTNLYTINLYDMASASPICLMARATPTKSWLWHQRLSHLNFDTINDLAKNDLVSGLPKFKYAKEHLCPSCEQGKSKRASHPPKPVPNSKQRLHLLHMDLCGPMRVASINGKRYILVIVDDYSRYTWVHFLRTKDETPEVIKNFLKNIYVRLQAPVIIVRTDNGTEFKNHALKEYFDSVGITHETSAAKTPQQNGVVERRNRTLVEAARTMLIFSHAPLFLWAEAIATACYTQNRSIIHRRFNKTPYELIQGRKPDISYLHVFGALCYPKNDREDIGKLGAKGDIGFFIGYSANSVAYRVYNRRTKKIMETMNVTFDELSAMAFEQNSSKPGLQSLTSGQISSGLELTYAPSTITPQKPSERALDILFEPLHNEYLGGQPSEAPRTVPAAPVIQNLQAPTASMTIQDSAPTPTNSSNTPNSSHNVDEQSQQHAQQQGNHTPLPTAFAADNVPNAVFEGDLFVNPFATSTESAESSTQNVDPSNMHTFYQPYQAQPTEKHLKEVKRIFCYLRGTVNAGLCKNQRDLPKDTPIDRLEVLRYDIGKRSKVRMGIMPTETEPTLEQTQQGVV